MKKMNKKIKSLVNNNRKTVVIQGLGFVGSAMVAALTQAKNKKGNLLYNVIGVDLTLIALMTSYKLTPAFSAYSVHS